MHSHLFLSFIILMTLLISSPGVYSAVFTITNKCDYPVWPGLVTDSDDYQLPTTGFALQPGESSNVSIPKTWFGRVWGRTFCTQNATTGNFSCLTGDCASSTVQCSGNWLSVISSTLAEFNLNYDGESDTYAISLVNGYNLPMLVSPHGGAGNCGAIGCVVNLNPACPPELSVVDNSSGETVESACLTFGHNSEYCCHSIVNCTQTPYSSFFKVACPQAYSYVFDRTTTNFFCSGADYAITFCPKNSNTSSKGNNCTTTGDGRTKCVDTTADTKNATNTNTSVDTKDATSTIVYTENAINTSVDTENAINTSMDTQTEYKFAGWKPVLAASFSGVGTIFITIYCFRKFSSSSFLHWRKANSHSNIEAFLKKHGSLAPTIYTYSQVKKMTNSFNDKLGQGGFGTVFKGKLPDSREVAVKVLKESKKDGEDFINEVASISQTSHVNVVSLLGFCFEGSKRALLYEYMVNGSLEKYIYQENNTSGADRQLGWETLYQIALGIARGLEYLHRGCNTRILHFDIKPHNILLDENFCPKISDFGLARVCPEKESIISKVTARGTPGYTAPEFFFRNLGGISHKSDVYSYGLMVLEMVGGRRNLCVGVDKTSEIYFPGWVHKRLLLDEELGLPGINHEEENQIARKLITVSLWCIQTSPSDRPSMGRVVEMLQGTLDSLQIPPRPYLSSPSRSPDRSVADSSTTFATTIEL